MVQHIEGNSLELVYSVQEKAHVIKQESLAYSHINYMLLSYRELILYEKTQAL